MTDFKTQIYLDGASEKEILEYDNDDINGFTFNPTLFKNLGIEKIRDPTPCASAPFKTLVRSQTQMLLTNINPPVMMTRVGI